MSDQGKRLLIIGHGTRDATGRRQLLATVRHIAELLPGTVVRHALLETDQLDVAGPRLNRGYFDNNPALPLFARHDVRSVLSQWAEQRVAEIVIAPLFLTAAGHIRRDLPRIIKEIKSNRSGLRIRCLPPIGQNPILLEVVAGRFLQAVKRAKANPEQSLLLLAGRGSHWPKANAEVREFAHKTGGCTSAGGVVVAFLAMARPSLTEGLVRAGQSRLSTVVVVPYMLYQGELMEQLCRIVEIRSSMSARQRLMLTDPLGDDPRMAKAVAEQFQRP